MEQAYKNDGGGRRALRAQWRRALLGTAGAAAMLFGAGQVAAQEQEKEPAVRVAEIGVLLGSYHTKTRGYYEDGQYRHFNEFNPGLSARFHVAAAPSWLRDVQVGYVARNSFGDPATFVAVENTLLDNRLARVTALTGVFPTGYNKRGIYDGVKPLFALAVEGQRRLSFNTPAGRLKPYVMAMPGGSQVPVVLAGGVKLARE
jgi:hypothetical protein